MQRLLTIALLAGLCACAGSTAHTSGSASVSTARASEPAEESTPAAASAVDVDGAKAPEANAASKVTPIEAEALPARVDAGAIPRSALVAVLSSGVGRFLQKVRAEPHLEGGRFVGWRLVSVFEGDARARVLRPGDTVLTVNGQGIERPEQFKEVWDKVATRDELVLLVQREGRRSELHYQIVP